MESDLSIYPILFYGDFISLWNLWHLGTADSISHPWTSNLFLYQVTHEVMYNYMQLKKNESL